MQVLLRNNISKLGKRGEIVDVKDGYARNYLVPRGLAVAVGNTDLKAIEEERKRLEKTAAAERAEVAGLVEKLQAAAVTITVKANEEGHLFGSVTAADIAAALTAEVVPVEEANVRLEEHIKELGVYEVPVHLSADIEDVIVKVYAVGE